MKHQFNITFLFGLLFLVGFGAYLTLKPFLVSLLVAFVLSQLFNNWYKKILSKTGNRKPLASLTTSLIILLLVLLPIVLITSIALTEVNDLYREIKANNLTERISYSIDNLPLEKIGISASSYNLKSFLNFDQIIEGIKNNEGLIREFFSKTYEGTTSFVFMIFIMFFSLYYLFKDSDELLKKVMNISPLKNKQEQVLLDKFIAISRATLKGSLVIAIVQATLVAIIFWITGVSSPILWGLIAIIFALIPLVGAGIIWLPVGLFMLILGNIWQGILIIAFGTLVISTIDNVMRPYLVGNDTSLHPLLVLLSTLGGISLFGMIGFLLGPVTIVLFISLLDIYQLEFKADLKRFNTGRK